MSEITIPYFWWIDAFLFGLIIGMWISYLIGKSITNKHAGRDL